MPVLNLTIQNKIHQLSCEEGDEARIQSLAEQLNGKLSELAAHAPGSSDTLLMIMLLLMLQDEANEGTASPAGPLPRDHEKTMINALDTVSSYLENLAKQLQNR